MARKVIQDFELFQKEFKKWQKLFGLNGYAIFFRHEAFDGGFAEIIINQYNMLATVRLNSTIADKNKPFKDVKRSAKHEAIHLLIGRLELNGTYRYTTQSEINEASEELVYRLEGLIP